MALKITSDNIASATLSTLGGGVKITTVAYPSSATAANPAGGETITVTGSGFNVGIIVYINNTIPCATTYINNTSLTFVAPATGVGTYNIVLYNTDGSSGVKPIGIIFSSLPSWVTSSGALLAVSINTSYSTSVTATGDGTITYSLTSGSLPTGLSLNSSTGAITGTPTVEETSNFSITATDSQNQTTSRSFSIAVVTTVSAVEYLVVAGGGGGGGGLGGGGGAGGLLTASGFAISAGTPYTVTVGAGGAGATAGVNATGTNGANSIFSSTTSIGGGGGGTCLGGGSDENNGLAGGSGGGGSGVVSGPAATGGTATSGQGFAGGTGATGTGAYGGAGGGGASAVGATGKNTGTGAGGNGLASSISGSSVTYGGGGGGGSDAAPASGGTGGGGNSGTFSAGAGVAGTANLGGGGGGGSGGGSNGGNGGQGGSGIVIIRYDSAFPAAASSTGSPTITTSGGYRVYKFTSSGSITF